MTTVLARHVICILGRWSDLDAVDAVVRDERFSGFELDREYSELLPDDRMTESFEASHDRVAPSMHADDWGAVRSHGGVAYVLSPPIRADRAGDVSGQALMLTAALLRSGAVAAKSESAGVAHGRDRWLELADQLAAANRSGDVRGAGAVLYRAWVKRPILDDEAPLYYSCGMHLLGAADLEIGSDVEVSEAVRWMDLLGTHLATQGAAWSPAAGAGLRLRADGPRRVMRRGECRRYDDDDFMFNPHGYVRLDPTGGPAAGSRAAV